MDALPLAIRPARASKNSAKPRFCASILACDALKNRGASLLLVGVTAVRGHFAANQPVQLLDPNGVDVGRGLCSMDSDQLRAAMNDTSPGESSPVVVHRDGLVLRSR